MIDALQKVKEVYKKYKKRIIAVIVSGILAIIIGVGAIGGLIYSHAKSNIQYSQEQLQKIALGKVPGEVVDAKKELNFKHGVFEYEFKIKDKENILQEVKLDTRYGAILGLDDHHKRENKCRYDKHEMGNGEH